MPAAISPVKVATKGCHQPHWRKPRLPSYIATHIGDKATCPLQGYFAMHAGDMHAMHGWVYVKNRPLVEIV